MKKLALLTVFLFSSAWSDPCDNSHVVSSIRPKAQWTMQSDNPATLIWMSTDSIKPSYTEIQTGVSNCLTAQAARAALKAQALIDARNALLPASKRIDAVLILENLDQ